MPPAPILQPLVQHSAAAEHAVPFFEQQVFPAAPWHANPAQQALVSHSLGVIPHTRLTALVT